MKTPLFIIVGADKGGVGKTTVARALLDYIATSGVKVRAFDCEAPDGDLKQFWPDAEIIDIAKVSDQMKIFDNLSPDVVTVVDVRAGLLSPTLKALDDSGMLEDVRRGAVTFAILHVLGSSVASLNEIVTVSRGIGPNTKPFLIKNNITETGLGELAEDPRYVEALKSAAAITIEVPKLTDVACDRIQQVGGTFTAFIKDEDPVGVPSPHSRILRGYVKTWLNKVWGEFGRVGLGELLK